MRLNVGRRSKIAVERFIINMVENADDFDKVYHKHGLAWLEVIGIVMEYPLLYLVEIFFFYFNVIEIT